jgi:hypothetical protein
MKNRSQAEESLCRWRIVSGAMSFGSPLLARVNGASGRCRDLLMSDLRAKARRGGDRGL